MTGLEIWLLAVGLAMDCFAVSIASGILLKRTLWRPMLTMAFFFGLFQAIMPLLGWIGASTFSHLIESLDHWIAFAILAFLGGRMVRESFKDEDCKKEYDPKSLKVVLALAVATSIDALAIGVSFAFLGMRDFSEILPPISIIGFVSFAMSYRITIRYPLWMWHCTKTTGRALGRYYPDYHRNQNINRTLVL